MNINYRILRLVSTPKVSTPGQNYGNFDQNYEDLGRH
jgi:hypothetical protein